MNPDKIIDGMMQELAAAVKGMNKAKTVEEKLAYSQIVRNLTESLGGFVAMAEGAMEQEYEEDFS